MRRLNQSVVFLMYHELETPGRATCRSEAGYMRYVIDAKEFEAQMAWLKYHGWQGSAVSGAFNSIKPTVAITFDDGCETDILKAAPMLRELGFGATFNVTVNFLGCRGYMSTSQLRELRSLSFEIGCHSMTHAYLSDLGQAELNREMVESKHRLEQILGESVVHFSCPGGRFNQRVVETARSAGYRSLSHSRSRANSVFDNLFDLGRVAIMRGTELREFERICRGSGLWHSCLRESLRQGAKALLGNSSYDRVRNAVLDRGEPPPAQG